MATITKRKNGWCVQVRRRGYAARNNTFPTKTEARAWGREQEALIDKGQLPITEVQLKVTRLAQLIEQYRSTVTPSKRSAETERLRLGRMMGDMIMDRLLIDLKPGDFAAYRDRRLAVVKPGTVRRELYLFANAIDVATKEWGYPFRSNPVRLISLPIANDARDRRLEGDEAETLRKALSASRNPFILPIVELAIETGLRRREVLELTWSNVDATRRIAFIPQTKTGQPRTIPLTDCALTIITTLTRSDDDRLFPITLNAFKQAWKRVQKRSGLEDLRFHDLRHEALSRFCELGLSVPELSVISGHKDPRMLFRYAHLRADDLARKLAGREWGAEVRQQGA
ncbi:integrase [Novosphingobium beihaiensis]|uniref:Site-specific integrase n=1 Tax=Novosphingobium beihaiensis TaxID=2930389 RepID=A0ABT0BP30_9SPHN|nr:site-specific integrase [Novosphingobium beihaiensis]MCJ2186464.1 site-specific integrase [Novosphingobium beihaiensis]